MMIIAKNGALNDSEVESEEFYVTAGFGSWPGTVAGSKNQFLTEATYSAMRRMPSRMLSISVAKLKRK